MGQPNMNRRQFVRVLSQRSTVIGIIGVLAAVFSLLDMPISAEQELKLVEGVLLLVSVIAIATKEEEPYRGVNRRASRGPDGLDNGSIHNGEQERKAQREGPRC
jgi:hypothetical protein